MKWNWKVVLILLCFAYGFTGSAAQSAELPLASYNTLDKVGGVLDNKNIVSKLKSFLGKDYVSFSDNFDVYGEPHQTSQGGLFVEGWLKDLYLEQASAFVIQPDGKAYAAWINPDDGEIQYRSNVVGGDSHQTDIVQWAKRFKTANSSNEKAGIKISDNFFETSKFKIKITALCNIGVQCNDVSYEGIRKSDGAVVRLNGKATVSDCGKDNCPVISYKFHNHDATYIINNVINNLTVIVNNKVVLSEDGNWYDGDD